MRFDTQINNSVFSFGDKIKVQVDLSIESEPAKQVIKQLEGIYLLLRAERIYDKQGRYHQFTNNYASTVLTPSGLPIENVDAFFSPALTGNKFQINPVAYVNNLNPQNKFFGYSNLTPFYKTVFVKKQDLVFTSEGVSARFDIQDEIGNDFPEGFYRFQVLALCKRTPYFYRVNVLPLFGKKKIPYTTEQLSPFSRNISYLPVIKIGNPQTPKMIWMLFMTDYSNGTQGIVSLEDSNSFRFNSRHTVPTKFILPPPDENNETRTYNLEPDFPTMFAKPALKLERAEKLDFQNPIPLNYKSGKLSVSVKNPDGTIADLGSAPFATTSQTGAATNTDKFQYQFKQYGKYLITLEGWIEDIWGNRYNGGGTYEVWVAHRLTFATSVKPGTPLEVGNAYPPSVIIHPPCPADVTVDVTLYRNSSKKDIKRAVVNGRANRFGYFYPREKFEKMIFDSPGEYLSQISASYTDPEGKLWLGSQCSGSVVAPPDSKLIVHGLPMLSLLKPPDNLALLDKQYHRSLQIKWLMFYPVAPKRAKINYEWENSKKPKDNKHLVSCTNMSIPHHSGDILYMANTHDPTNFSITSEFIIRSEEDLFPGIKEGLSPFSTTTNGYQPQGYPEFLEKQCYGYVSAIRAGLTARYIIAEDLTQMFDSYWQIGSNFAGQQINNSYNGDLPNDIYEFMCGVVYRDLKKGINRYGIYAAMGVVLPKGSYSNQILAPLKEPIFEINGRSHYLFDAGAPLPGMVFETGDILRAGAMVFPPIGNVTCLKTVTCPSGKKYQFKGTTNKIGLAKMDTAPEEKIVIKEPGVYEVEGRCESQGKTGDFVGSGDGKYYIYAVDPKDTNEYFNLDLPRRFSIRYDQVLQINGHVRKGIRNAKIYYTLIMPGFIMDEGIIPIQDQKFSYRFSPQDVAVQFPNYDLVSYENPTEQRMADTVIFTFFLTGINQNNKPVCSVRRFILRGDKGIVLN